MESQCPRSKNISGLTVISPFTLSVGFRGDEQDQAVNNLFVSVCQTQNVLILMAGLER
jgi:hypothetical protein